MEICTDQATGIIVKSDRNGRTRYTGQYKREVLDAFESSSLSAPEFARQCGIKYPTLAAWIAGRKRGGQAPARPHAPRFLLAEMDSAATGPSALEIRLPGGAVARVSDPAQVRLLAVLLQQLS